VHRTWHPDCGAPDRGLAPCQEQASHRIVGKQFAVPLRLVELNNLASALRCMSFGK
jgi:hypothetical protein